jgi:hypothetical protein
MSGQLQVPAALLPGKQPPVPSQQEAGWALKSVWTLWRREKSLGLVGNGTSVVQPVALSLYRPKRSAVHCEGAI